MPISAHQSSDEFQKYNGLDACMTFECFNEMARLYPQQHRGPTYNFARALQAPALDMMRRGWLIDIEERAQASRGLRLRIARLESTFQRLAMVMWDKPLNPNSPLQLKDFFYSWMGIPQIKSFQKGEVKLPMDIDILEQLALYLHARPFVNIILLIRDLQKQLQVIDVKLGRGNRIYYNIKITGTVTGRFSSSESNEEGGRNIQNIDEELRRMFIADPGKKLFAVDLEQSDSAWVGWMCGVLFDDWTYHEARESGDLHTKVCKLIWPELHWTGQPKLDRATADQDFARGNSRRQIAKKAGHAVNFLGKAAEIARQLGLPSNLIEDFIRRYLGAFPAISKVHQWVLDCLRSTKSVTSPFGRTRHFFDRTPYADCLRTGKIDKVLRDAMAQIPQSCTSDHEKLGLWRIWRYLPEVQLLAEGHDAVYGNFDPSQEARLIPIIQKLMSITLHHGTHTLLIPTEAKTGWNWSTYYSAEMEAADRLAASNANLPYTPKRLNPNGLKKFSLQHPDLRTRV